MKRMSTSTPANPKPAANPVATDVIKSSNFLRQIIESDLQKGTYASRRWAGSPGDAAVSYTHLDVYKRQLLEMTALRKSFFTLPARWRVPLP